MRPLRHGPQALPAHATKWAPELLPRCAEGALQNAAAGPPWCARSRKINLSQACWASQGTHPSMHTSQDAPVLVACASAQAVHLSQKYTKYTFAAPARKSQLFNTKVVREVNARSLASKANTFQCQSCTQVNFCSPSLKVATLRYESRTRSKLPQFQLQGS